jgi:HEPN domain-containing protein
MKKIAGEWLKAAHDDLRVIAKIITDSDLTHMVAFHSQQCIEKSLKSIIEELELGTVRIHNLVRLREIVRPHIEIEVDPEIVEKLDKLYTDSRYPADFGLLVDGRPTMEDAQLFQAAALSVYEKVKNDLEKPREAHSGIII